jgi:hypothetical protein
MAKLSSLETISSSEVGSQDGLYLAHKVSDNPETYEDRRINIEALAGALPTEDMEYDNSESGLTATNVQEAIDELAAGGREVLGDLTDVTISSPAANQLLQYNATTEQWENKKYIEGTGNTVSGTDAHAEGNTNVASGTNAHAEGYGVVALGAQSHAEGYQTQASTYQSHAEGKVTEATGENSHAEGAYTKATGFGAHSEGCGLDTSTPVVYVTSSGVGSHAEGRATTASAEGSHSGGYCAKASGRNSFAHGGEHDGKTIPLNFFLDLSSLSDREDDTKFYFDTVHAFSGSVNLSLNNVENWLSCIYVAQGLSYGFSVHDQTSEGIVGGTGYSIPGPLVFEKSNNFTLNVTITNTYSFPANSYVLKADCRPTMSAGWSGRLENDQVKAEGESSVAIGGGTVAIGSFQTVVGNLNVPDSNKVFIVGNGTVDFRGATPTVTRSNAMTVDWDGNIIANNIPAPPTIDGTYTLTCTVTNGIPTYSWT